MDRYAGIDVSLECSSICVVDGIMHRMLADGTQFNEAAAAAKRVAAAA